MTLSEIVVIFDLDGLLVDSQDIGRRAVNMALQELGSTSIVSPGQWYEHFIMQGGSSGLTSRLFVGKLLGTDDLRSFWRARDHAWHILLQNEELPVYEDALTMARWCQSECKNVAIATNNDVSLLELVLSQTKYGEIFKNNYVAAKALGIQKPNPLVLKKALATIGEESPGGVIMVGDTLADHELAVNFASVSSFPVRSIIRPDPYLKQFGNGLTSEIFGDRRVHSLSHIQPSDLLATVRD